MRNSIKETKERISYNKQRWDLFCELRPYKVVGVWQHLTKRANHDRKYTSIFRKVNYEKQRQKKDNWGQRTGKFVKRRGRRLRREQFFQRVSHDGQYEQLIAKRTKSEVPYLS